MLRSVPIHELFLPNQASTSWSFCRSHSVGAVYDLARSFNYTVGGHRPPLQQPRPRFRVFQLIFRFVCRICADHEIRFALLTCSLVSFPGSVSAQTGSVSDRLEKQSGLTLKQSAAPTFTLPPGIALGEAISARNAAAIALWNSKALEADLAALDLSRHILEAGVHRNFSLSTLLPVGAKPFEFLATFPIEEALATQTPHPLRGDRSGKGHHRTRTEWTEPD